MASVTIKGVTKSFGKVTVLQEFNQKFEDGEFITLLGPSGCGKTTMLRLIAGFEKPSSGEIYIGDKLVEGGRMGELSSKELTNSLKEMGLEIKRFKTGTSPRIDKRTIDFTELEEQEGETGYSERKKNIRGMCHLMK